MLINCNFLHEIEFFNIVHNKRTIFDVEILQFFCEIEFSTSITIEVCLMLKSCLLFLREIEFFNIINNKTIFNVENTSNLISKK